MATTMHQTQLLQRPSTAAVDLSAPRPNASQSLPSGLLRSLSASVVPQAVSQDSPEFIKSLSKLKRSKSSIATSPGFYSLTGSFLSSSADSRFDSSKFLKGPQAQAATPRTFPPIRGLSSNDSPKNKSPLTSAGHKKGSAELGQALDVC